MQSQTKSTGVKLPEVHGVSKSLDPNIQPEKQSIKPPKIEENFQIRPRIGQGRAELRRKKRHLNQPIAQSVEHSNKISEIPK